MATSALLERIAAPCLALPDARHEDWGRHADFRVRGKSFARFHDDHHGDGIVAVLCRSELGENVDRAGRDPQRFFVPAFNARHGWFGIRLDVPDVDWADVTQTLSTSRRLPAPKTLVARFDAAQRSRADVACVGHARSLSAIRGGSSRRD